MLKVAPLPRTLDAALRDLAHKRLEVRVSAVNDLARLAVDEPSARATDALLGALEDGAAKVRARAAVALADAELRESIPALLGLLDDPDPHVREMALVALGELSEVSDSESVAAIREALDAASPALRFQALIAHARVHGADALSRLVAAFGDPDAHVRYVAVRSAEEHLSAADGAARSAVLAGAQALLDDPEPKVRAAAAILLTHAGERAGHAVLVSVIAGERGAVHEPEDEQTAIELAGELELEAAVPGLERRAFGGLLHQDAFAWQARVALARMGHTRARQNILSELGSWSYERRTLAAAAAGRARVSEARAILLGMRADPRRADPHAVEEALALLA